MKRGRAARALLAISTVPLAACSTVRTPSKSDPWEGFNRTMFKVNDQIDRAVLKPVATAYVKAVSPPVQSGVTNFFSNVGDVYIGANDLLQGKITAGTQDAMRVVINTVFGVGGVFDVATLAKLPKHHADFGLTLGHYSVPPGPYLVLPLLGSSTVRDAAGFLVDRQADPTSYIDPVWASTALYGVRLVSARAALLDASDLLANAALDKYSFVRNTYLQRRQYLVYDSSPPPPLYDEDNGENGAAGAGVDNGPAPAHMPPGAAASGSSALKAEPARGASATGAPVPSTVPPQQVLPPSNALPSFRFR